METVTSKINDLDFLKEKMQNFLGLSKSDNTYKKYSALFKKWVEFCNDRNLVHLPASPLNVALFLTRLICDKKSKNVVIPTVYAIKYFHEKNGYNFSIKEPYIKNMMEAAKRHANSFIRNRKDPVSRDLIIEICEKCRYSERLVDQRDLTIMVLCFAGFFKVR